MKRSIVAIAAILAAASPCAAQEVLTQPDHGDLTNHAVAGNAPEMCALGEPTLSNTNPAVNIRNLSGRTVTIDELSDRETLSTRATSVELSFEGFCNYPHQITIESDNNGLFRQSAGNETAAGFGNAVPYTAELRWADQTVRLQADALTRREVRQSSIFDDPATGPLLLRVEVARGATNVATAAPLLAGEYRDIIRITVGPQ
jgi:hypothetical protein